MRETMKITRQTVAEKITDYLHGKLGQAQLVDWAEHSIMDADFDETDTDFITDIVGRLGLADVAEFGLRWRASGREPDSTERGAERERTRLGNPGNRDSRQLISTCEKFLRRPGYRAKVIVSATEASAYSSLIAHYSSLPFRWQRPLDRSRREWS